MTSIGIDLGTVVARAARVAPRGAPVLIPDHRAKRQFETPAMVSVAADGALVGLPAEDCWIAAESSPVACDFKQKLGTGETVLTDAINRNWTSAALTALVFKKLHRMFSLTGTIPSTVPSCRFHCISMTSNGAPVLRCQAGRPPGRRPGR